jgi:hypothetical protein
MEISAFGRKLRGRVSNNLDAMRNQEWWLSLARDVYCDEFSGFGYELLVDTPPTDTLWQAYTSWNNATTETSSDT